ncbi:hypothetical protein EXS74_02640 [Candidatus Woesearchaeota archaeon]|nr:hypothetical protein [Candidatus Woesearchaeota archaeon]
MSLITKIGIGAFAVLGVGIPIGVHSYLEKKEKEAQEEAARTLSYDWQRYFRDVCEPGASVSFTDETVDFCSDTGSEKTERERILEIAKGDGSYTNDAGTPRPRRQYYKRGASGVPRGFGGDFIGVYTAIPNHETPRSVEVIPKDSLRDVCYVRNSGTLIIGGRKYNTVNLEGQLRYCLDQSWRTEECDVRYGAVVFVQKPDFCEDLSTFQQHISTTEGEVSLEKWKQSRTWNSW